LGIFLISFCAQRPRPGGLVRGGQAYPGPQAPRGQGGGPVPHAGQRGAAAGKGGGTAAWAGKADFGTLPGGKAKTPKAQRGAGRGGGGGPRGQINGGPHGRPKKTRNPWGRILGSKGGAGGGGGGGTGGAADLGVFFPPKSFFQPVSENTPPRRFGDCARGRGGIWALFSRAGGRSGLEGARSANQGAIFPGVVFAAPRPRRLGRGFDQKGVGPGGKPFGSGLSGGTGPQRAHQKNPPPPNQGLEMFPFCNFGFCEPG